MFERIVKTTHDWKVRREARSALSHMDERMLRDIGLDRFRASQESRKPFWKK